MTDLRADVNIQGKGVKVRRMKEHQVTLSHVVVQFPGKGMEMGIAFHAWSGDCTNGDRPNAVSSFIVATNNIS